MKSYASISLDLDNQWSYMKTHGDPRWEEYPSYLDIFVPYVLDTLERLNLRITFFVVGKDASLEKNKALIKLLAAKGHEIGNHSFHHEVWLHQRTKEQIRKEILSTEEHIIQITGQKPVGFRGPGFVWSLHLLEILSENGYLYDASTLPMYIGPLARIYYFRTSNLTKEEKRQRKGIYGSFRDGLKPVKPYYWELASGKALLEIPVTTMPIIKIPFHLSYLLYLSRFSHLLMFLYLNMGIALCRITKTEPSFLLHPLDLISGDHLPELAFFPGMDIDGSKKIKLFEKVIQNLSKHFTLINMSSHAESLLKEKRLKRVIP